MPVVNAGVAIVAGENAAAAPEGALGLFAALLELVVAEVTDKEAATPEGSGLQFVVPEDAKAPEAPALPALVAPNDASPVAPAPRAAAETDATVLADILTPEFLTDLVEQLAALQDGTEGPTPLDPVLEKKLTDSLDALAAALGLPIPDAPLVDPAITAAATIEMARAGVLDPLATIEPDTTIELQATGPVAVPVGKAPAGAAPVAAPGAIVPADGNLPVVAATVDAAPLTFGAVKPLADGGAEPELLVRELADKLAQLAEAVEPRAPGLAKRLEALAEKLTSGDVDPAFLARLGIGADVELPEGNVAQAIARLLAPGREPRTLPEPARFAMPALTLPDALAMTPEKKNAGDAQAPLAPPSAPAATLEPMPNAEAKVTAPIGFQANGAPEQAQPTRVGAAATMQSAPLHEDTVADTPAPTAAPALPPAPASLAAETKAVLAAYKAPAQQLNIPQVAFEIVRQVQAGNTRFEIRLDPPELGRIDVKLDLDSAGNINARMTVERSETLDLMQRDRQVLERALAQAGLDSNKTTLEFSLRQNPFAREGFDLDGNGNGQGNHPVFGAAAEADNTPADEGTNTYRGLATAGGINLFV
jgi:flagellar hook-length control protein FliK